ncbi:MAG: hypothetical protein KAS32_29350 [Candidatus Peribacteraceae bacterium]|nr:hypothetical protein [Candidatus Peribacteraceae bacterium]
MSKQSRRMMDQVLSNMSHIDEFEKGDEDKISGAIKVVKARMQKRKASGKTKVK